MSTVKQTGPGRSIEELISAILSTNAANSGHVLQFKLIELEQKLKSGQFNLAVLGQMKRGKSSFINALLGAEVLPTGVLPATAIVTEIEYGSSITATVTFAGGADQRSIPLDSLADYVTEAGNPGNRKQVERVSIAYPSQFLAKGITLIDTPGIGSTHTHNTRTTEQYLGHVDAGIVVLSVDLPITEVESSFLHRIKDEIPQLFFILNKTDIASTADAEAMEAFLREELHRLGLTTPEIFSLSAKFGLEGKCSDAPDTLQRELHAFESRLYTFIAQEKRRVLVRSVAADVLQVAKTLRFVSAIGLRAVSMDTDQLEQKRSALEQILREVELQKLDLKVLIQRSAAELLNQLEGELESRISDAVSTMRGDIKRFEQKNAHLSGRALGIELENFLMKQLEKVFSQWLAQEDQRIKARLDALASRHSEHANAILQHLCVAAGNLFETPIVHLSVSCPLQIQSLLRYRVERIFYSLDNFLLLLPGFLLRPLIFRRMQRDIPLLLDMNGGRIRFDYLERIRKTVTAFERELLSSIATLTEPLKAAIQLAPDSARQCSETVSTLDSIVRDCLLLLSDSLIARQEICPP